MVSQMRGLIFWFTGLSGSGKTTVAELVAERLKNRGGGGMRGKRVLIQDGDEMRATYVDLGFSNLGFSHANILVNNEIMAGTCSANRLNCDVVFASLISPLKAVRATARHFLSPGFYEIYFNSSLETCIKRDVKGLYAKKGEEMIGVGPPYEVPENPDLTLNTGYAETPPESADKLLGFILSKLAGENHPQEDKAGNTVGKGETE